MMDQLNFIERLAWYSLRRGPSTDLKDIAWLGIEEGYETPSLLVLAGLERNESHYVIHGYYEQALEELDLVITKEQAALILVRAVIGQVLNKGFDPFEACRIIFYDILELTDLGYLGQHFSFDGLGLNKVYESYLYIDDAMSYSTDVNLFDKLKQDARVNMKAWLETHS